MSEFKAITTQEEFDAAIKERLARQEAKHQAELATWKEKIDQYSALETEIEELKKENQNYKSLSDEMKSKDSEIADLQSKLTGFETMSLKQRVALQYGVPFDLADRLVGDDELSIGRDAQRLVEYMQPKPPAFPSKDVSINNEDPYKALAQNLNLED